MWFREKGPSAARALKVQNLDSGYSRRGWILKVVKLPLQKDVLNFGFTTSIGKGICRHQSLDTLRNLVDVKELTKMRV